MKSIALLISVAIVWLLFIVLMSPLQLPVTVAATFIPSLKRYRYGLWIAQDQLVNAVHAGNPDITVSSRVGWLAEQGSKTAIGMAYAIDFLFFVAIGQRDHCKASIERDEKHKGWTK